LADKKQYISALLLVFALFALNSSELFHHHEEGSHDNAKCQACLFNKTLNSAAVSEPSLNHKLYFSNNEFLSEDTHTSYQTIYSSTPGRSPPAVSHI
jgi:hypothetical protein